MLYHCFLRNYKSPTKSSVLVTPTTDLPALSPAIGLACFVDTGQRRGTTSPKALVLRLK